MSRHRSPNLRSPNRAGAPIHPSRAGNEHYPTPPEATRALLDAEKFDGSIWEPACGKGWMARELTDAGYFVVSTDIADYGFGQGGLDFLSAPRPLAKNIITNPPYGRGLADNFLRQALAMIEQTGGRMAMLLNLASLCHPLRHESYVRRPPSLVYALDECICYPNGISNERIRRANNQRYCWAIWDATPATETRLRWLTTSPYRQGGSS